MNNYGKTPERRQSTVSASIPNNLWLAVGDETGQFEKNTDTGFHGVALVLARAGDWPGIASEDLLGRSVQYRLNRPVQGLESHLTTLFPNEEQRRVEQRKHHVLTAFRYFERPAGPPPGIVKLDAESDDPVLKHLLASMRWLAGHPRLLSIGVYGRGSDLYNLHRSDDTMAALGNLYGLLLAMVYPFLGPSPRLRVLLSGRTETAESPGVARTAVSSTQERLPSGQTGGDRINIGFTQDSFWHHLESLKQDLNLPGGAEPRQRALAVHSHPTKFKRQLNQDGIADVDTDMMKNLADLACGMMATLDEGNRPRKIRLNLGKQPGPNMRFFAMREIAP
jgi:hypothetical protein